MSCFASPPDPMALISTRYSPGASPGEKQLELTLTEAVGCKATGRSEIASPVRLSSRAVKTGGACPDVRRNANEQPIGPAELARGDRHASGSALTTARTRGPARAEPEAFRGGWAAEIGIAMSRDLRVEDLGRRPPTASRSAPSRRDFERRAAEQTRRRRSAAAAGGSGGRHAPRKYGAPSGTHRRQRHARRRLFAVARHPAAAATGSQTKVTFVLPLSPPARSRSTCE